MGCVYSGKPATNMLEETVRRGGERGKEQALPTHLLRGVGSHRRAQERLGGSS